MAKKLLHTFVILGYRESPYIEEAIISIKKQTVPSKIFISTGTPCLFLDKLSEKYNIPILKNKNETDTAGDWNFAYKNSSTRYLTLAHQDDIYLPKYTEECLKLAESYSKNLITFTGYKELINNREKNFSLNLLIKNILLIFYLYNNSLQSKFLKKMSLIFGNPIPCPSVMYNVENIRDFEFSSSFDSNMDWDAWARLTEKNGSFLRVNKKLLLYRIHEKSITSLAIRNNKRYQEDYIMFKRFWPEPPVAYILSLLYSLGYR